MNANTDSKYLDSKAFIRTAVTIGGSLEWYEIGFFIAWTLLIQQKAGGLDISLAESINAGIVILIAALANGGARALGGWYFGKKGDSSGRRIAFPLTLLFATLPSWIVVILSFFISSEAWITISTLLFGAVKLAQAMPAGGELPGAICYLYEAADQSGHLQSHESRRYSCSFALLGPQIGIGLSAIVCLLLKDYVSKSDLLVYVWRYVFIANGVMGIIGYLMRKKLHETAEYLELQAHHENTHEPIKEIFTLHKRKLLNAFTLSIFEVTVFATVCLSPYYFQNKPFNLSITTILILTICYTFLFAFFLPIVGYLASKFMEFPWLKVSVWGIILFSPITCWFFYVGSLIVSITLICILIFLVSIQAAILPSILGEIFPTRIRYTGIAFSFNICDGVLWAGLTGISYSLILKNDPLFLLIPCIGALAFFIGVYLCKSSKKIVGLLR